MAIGIFNIKVNGKRVRNLGQVEVAKRIEKLIKEEMSDVEVEVRVNRYYDDRWYSIKRVTELIKDGIEMSLERLAEKKKAK